MRKTVGIGLNSERSDAHKHIERSFAFSFITLAQLDPIPGGNPSLVLSHWCLMMGQSFIDRGRIPASRAFNVRTGSRAAATEVLSSLESGEFSSIIPFVSLFADSEGSSILTSLASSLISILPPGSTLPLSSGALEVTVCLNKKEIFVKPAGFAIAGKLSGG
jgi:hypothetical protein